MAGERALRVDILERLADLIRPAVAYRPGVTVGEPPAGAADGDGFVATNAMTSLVGASGADFGGILKALGYASQTRKGPAITVPLAKAPDPVAAAPAAQAAETAPEGEAPAEAAESTAEAAAVEPVETVDMPVVEAAAAEAPVAETPAEPVAAIEGEMSDMAVEVEASEAAAPAEPAPAAEAEEIEVWRPQRFQRPDRQPGQRRDRGRGQGAPRGEARPRPVRPARPKAGTGLPRTASSRADLARRARRSRASTGPRPAGRSTATRSGLTEMASLSVAARIGAVATIDRAVPTGARIVRRSAFTAIRRRARTASPTRTRPSPSWRS